MQTQLLSKPHVRESGECWAHRSSAARVNSITYFYGLIAPQTQESKIYGTNNLRE
jgi:hypothetical protein